MVWGPQWAEEQHFKKPRQEVSDSNILTSLTPAVVMQLSPDKVINVTLALVSLDCQLDGFRQHLIALSPDVTV